MHFSLVGNTCLDGVVQRVSLLHRNGEVRVPRDVNLVTDLDFFEDGWIDDASAVFPFVRSNETDRRCVLVDCTDSRGYCFVRRRLTPRLRRLPILEPRTSPATGASPGGFNLAVTVLLYVIVTLSPTFSSSKRFAVFGTSIVSNFPSAVLRCTIAGSDQWPPRFPKG